MSALPALPLPRFALDGAHRSALVVGRARELGPVSDQDIERYVIAAQAEARATGLPLAVVCAAHVGDGGEIYCGCAAGLVLATTEQGHVVEVDKGLLGRTHGDVPAAFWAALEAAGLTFPTPDEEDPECPSIGTFVTPAGWSVASVFLGPRQVGPHGDTEGDGELLVTSAAEDSAPPAPMTAADIERVLSSSEPLVLEAAYC